MIQLRFSNPFKLSVILVRDELTIVTSRLDKKNPIMSLEKSTVLVSVEFVYIARPLICIPLPYCHENESPS